MRTDGRLDPSVALALMDQSLDQSIDQSLNGLWSAPAGSDNGRDGARLEVHRHATDDCHTKSHASTRSYNQHWALHTEMMLVGHHVIVLFQSTQ